MSIADEIIVKLTADVTTLQSGMEAGAKSVEQAAAEISASVGEAGAASEEAGAAMAASFEAAGEKIKTLSDSALFRMNKSLNAFKAAAAEQAKVAADLAAEQAAAQEAAFQAVMEKERQAASAHEAEIAALNAERDASIATSAEEAVSAKAFNEAVLAKQALLIEWNNALKLVKSGAIETADAEAVLDRVQAAGAMSAAEATAALEALSAAEKGAGAAAVEEAAETAVASDATKEFTVNSRVMGEVSTIVSEAMAGNFGRIRRSAAALANQSGLLQSAFSFLLSPAGLVTAAFAAIAAEALDASEQIDKLERSARAGGGFVGMPPGDLEEIAQQFKQMGYDVRTARETLDTLASSGKVTSAQLANAAQTSMDLAKLTGESADKIAEKLTRMTSGGIRGIAEMNAQYHFLNATQFDHIDALFKEGQASQAVAAAFEAFKNKENEAVQETQKSTGMSEGLWASMGTIIANTNDSVERFISGAGTLNEKIAQLDKQIKGLRAGDGQYEPAAREQKINALLKEREALLDQLDQKRQKARNDAKAEEAESNREQAIIHKEGAFSTTHVKDGDEAGLQQLEYAAQQQGHEMSLAEQKAYWQERYNIEKDGGAAEAQNAQAAMGKIVAIQKQIDEKAIQSAKEASRQAAEAQRKDNAATMQALEVKRAATQEYSAQRIAMDAQIVATAEKLYGQDSAQYRAALQQKLSDTQQFIQRQKELAVSQADSDRQIAEAKIANAREQAQTEFDAGRITASQLLQTELDLDRQKLAADLAYYNAKKQLDINDVKATLEDNKQIVLAKLSADQQMQKDEQKFFKDSEKNWKQYSQRITGAMQNAVNSMLFQHQSLRSGLASIAESIGETFIEAAVMKPLEKWIAAEGEKLTASLTTMTTQSTAEETQRATNTAADIADKTAGVIRAAGLAGAQGTASFAAAPWPIDIGAPAFGVAMAATAASFASMASAAGGWERVPADGMMTELHKNEMVLPAHVAEPVRQMAKNGGAGGAGGAMHVTVLANDARSFKDMLRRNPRAIAEMAAHMKRNGYRV